MISVTEQQRQAIQHELASSTTAQQRNQHGQVATPYALAQVMAEVALRYHPAVPVRFLDPALGTGVFFSALLASDTAPLQATGLEIDAALADTAHSLWGEHGLTVQHEDFLSATPAPRYTLLLANPPYVRHHHIPTATKQRLQVACQHTLGILPSGLSGLYCYFIYQAHHWLADDGVAAWLVPAEFMDVNYGQHVKAYLTQHVTLLRVHRFAPDDMQFDDALVTSAVIWYRKATPPPNHCVTFSDGRSVHQPQHRREIALSHLTPAHKWSTLFHTTTRPTSRTTLGDYFEIKRGIATGANEYFILSAQAVADYQLPPEFLLPILPSPRQLTDDPIAPDLSNLPEPRYLLSCSLSEPTIQQDYPTLWRYLQRGVEMGIHQRYLCQHRTPWYRQEVRPPAPLLCSYMGRHRPPRSPFRFFLNASDAVAPNVYLNLYPYLHTQDDVVAVWRYLKALPAETVMQAGRVYGGGLHKIEPKELERLPMPSLAEISERYGSKGDPNALD